MPSQEVRPFARRLDLTLPDSAKVSCRQKAWAWNVYLARGFLATCSVAHDRTID